MLRYNYNFTFFQHWIFIYFVFSYFINDYYYHKYEQFKLILFDCSTHTIIKKWIEWFYTFLVITRAEHAFMLCLSNGLAYSFEHASRDFQLEFIDIDNEDYCAVRLLICRGKQSRTGPFAILNCLRLCTPVAETIKDKIPEIEQTEIYADFTPRMMQVFF